MGVTLQGKKTDGDVRISNVSNYGAFVTSQTPKMTQIDPNLLQFDPK